jgi:hypothetical protein
MVSWSQILYFLYHIIYYIALTHTQLALYPEEISEKLIFKKRPAASSLTDGTWH